MCFRIWRSSKSVELEAVVLTGGSSRRMGSDKASLVIKGERASDRMVRLLQSIGLETTILGPGGKPDFTPGAGPLAAISNFSPTADWVFVASCDIPLFDPRLVSLLMSRRNSADAVLPIFEQRIQPLCALYSSKALESASQLVQSGESRVLTWIDTIHVNLIDEADLKGANLSPNCVCGANTPEEWAALIERNSQ